MVCIFKRDQNPALVAAKLRYNSASSSWTSVGLPSLPLLYPEADNKQQDSNLQCVGGQSKTGKTLLGRYQQFLYRTIPTYLWTYSSPKQRTLVQVSWTLASVSPTPACTLQPAGSCTLCCSDLCSVWNLHITLNCVVGRQNFPLFFFHNPGSITQRWRTHKSLIFWLEYSLDPKYNSHILWLQRKKVEEPYAKASQLEQKLK